MLSSATRLLLLLAFMSAAHAQTAKKEPREMIPAPFDQYCARRVVEISSADWTRDSGK
jgi:hypothetical protein